MSQHTEKEPPLPFQSLTVSVRDAMQNIPPEQDANHELESMYQVIFNV